MSSIWDVSTTAGSNTNFAGINIAPGGPASSVGPTLREFLAETKGALIAIAGAGTADAITASLTPAPAALVDGMRVYVRATAPNTLTNPTFQLNALGSVGTIKKLGGTALVPGDISGAGHLCELEYVSSDNHWELLNPAPIASAWSTGDVKLTVKAVADAGWVMMNDGTIGDASSGAANRANADTQALFTLLWNNVSNTNCPVSGGRGASAAADFAAHKTITLPLALGRALAVAGAGSGLTARNLGDTTGAETATLTQANLPNCNFAVTDPGHHHGLGGRLGVAFGSGGIGGLITDTDISVTDNATSGITVSSGGSGTGHNNMQPTSFLNVMMKL